MTVRHWIKLLTKDVSKEKIYTFAFFCVLSFAAWFITKLTGTHTGTVYFETSNGTLPENTVLIEPPPEKIGVDVRATGFQLMGYWFSHEKIPLELTGARKNKDHYYIQRNQYRRDIERQLPSSVEVLRILNDTLRFKLAHKVTRNIKVKPEMRLSFSPNFRLADSLEIEPQEIEVSGPDFLLDSLKTLITEKAELTNIKGDFSMELAVLLPEKIQHLSFSEETVTVKGLVERYSEKILEVPVKIINLPSDRELKIFPDKVKVVFRASLGELKNIETEAFEVLVDYLEITEDSKTLIPKLSKKPAAVSHVRIAEEQLEFLINKLD